MSNGTTTTPPGGAAGGPLFGIELDVLNRHEGDRIAVAAMLREIRRQVKDHASGWAIDVAAAQLEGLAERIERGSVFPAPEPAAAAPAADAAAEENERREEAFCSVVDQTLSSVDMDNYRAWFGLGWDAAMGRDVSC